MLASLSIAFERTSWRGGTGTVTPVAWGGVGTGSVRQPVILYCERNLIERFFNKLKHFRGIVTRYDKLARNFLAAVQLVGAIILLN